MRKRQRANVAGRKTPRGRSQAEAVPDEVETPDQFESRRARAAALAGTADRALLVAHLERARGQRERARGIDVDPLMDDGAPPRRGAHLITDDGKVRRAASARRPGHPPMFAKLATSIELRADGASSGLLRVPVDAEMRSGLVGGSLRLARWDDGTGRFHLLAGSDMSTDAGYVHARVDRSGIYGVLGLPADDRVLTTIEMMSTLGDLLGPDGSPDLLPKICGLILCAEPGAAASGGPGDLCTTCLGGGGTGIDLDLFNVLERAPGVSFTRPSRPIPPRCDEWESVGPNNVPGRMTALAIHPTNSKIMYAAAAAGGVFKSTDRGGTWQPLWHDQLSLAIGGLAISASQPDVLYAATGEWGGPFAAPNNHFPGVGVYRTTDGGKKWELLARIASTETSAVAVDPVDARRVYVAGDLALHRTCDGGRSWDLAGGNTKGVFDGLVTDVAVDPDVPGRVYIGVHNDGVWRSTTGGDAWTKLTNGIASGAAAESPKIALGRRGAHGTDFVAVLMAKKVYTSIDGGATFGQRTGVELNFFGSGPGWCSAIAVDPTDERVLLAGHVMLSRSADGGATWTLVGLSPPSPTYLHADKQALAFDPTDHDRVYVATDSGVSVSIDNGRRWSLASFGLVTTQCWTVAASQGSALQLAITTQDTHCYRSMPGSHSFEEILPIEGGIVEYEPGSSAVLYAQTAQDYLKRSANGGTTWTVVHTGQDLTEALAIGGQNRSLLLALRWPGGSAPLRGWLERSADRGATWALMISLGRPSAVSFAPSDDQIAYAGGLYQLFRSTDAGQTWTAMPTGPLPNGSIRQIAVHPRDPGRFYVAFGALGVRQLWRGDVGAVPTAVTWTDVTGRIAAASLPDLAITAVVVHPTLEGTLFVSNILGVYRSVDGGASWRPFDEGLPNCFVSDLDLRPNGIGSALYASTMGRGVYRRVV